MQQVNFDSYAARVRAKFAGARFAMEVSTTRSKKLQTMEQARASVAKKLRDNKAYFVNNSLKKPDMVYKQQSSNTYAVGIKYTNRYLQGVFDGENWHCNVQAAELCDVLEFYATEAEAGFYDKYIQAIMDAKRKA